MGAECHELETHEKNRRDMGTSRHAKGSGGNPHLAQARLQQERRPGTSALTYLLGGMGSRQCTGRIVEGFHDEDRHQDEVQVTATVDRLRWPLHRWKLNSHGKLYAISSWRQSGGLAARRLMDIALKLNDFFYEERKISAERLRACNGGGIFRSGQRIRANYWALPTCDG